MRLTPKQLKILQFIEHFRNERGISPTLQEIADHFRVTKITIYEHINTLERRGAIKREKHLARSIEITCKVPETSNTNQIDGILTEETLLIRQTEYDSSGKSFSIPLASSGRYILVRTNKYSPEIRDGDIIHCQNKYPPNNRWVVVQEEGKPVLRKYDTLKPKTAILWVVKALCRDP